MASRIKYLWLLVFQVILVILFFVFVRYDGDKNVNIRGYEDAHVMIYVGFGFLMTFLMKYCYGALGINWMLAALVAQWSIITQGLFHMKDMTIPLNKKTILEADIMSATVLITFGALLGRASVNQLLFIAIVEALIGSLNLYLIEAVIKASDVGGSMAIHSYGAFFGIAVSGAWVCCRKQRDQPQDEGHPLEKPSYMTDVTSMIVSGAWMRCRKRRDQPQDDVHPFEGPSYSSYTTDVTSMIGSIFLFIYWPSFNAALTGSDADYQRAVVNTYLSLAACSVVTFVLSAFLRHGKFEMEHIQNSTLAGGVGVGTVCNMHITAGGAILIGIGAAFVSVFGFAKLKASLYIQYGNPFLIRKCGLLDTCGVLHLHGFPGVYSGIISVIVAALATEKMYGAEGLKTVFEAIGHGRSTGMQGAMQLAALLCSLGLAIVFGVITGCITRLKIFDPLSKEQQFNDEQFWEIPT
ncbi:ammonium transporter Rh type A-like [Cydia strobilella]|uniref:ammonium transporter Rh type A-like n=1 Tax=Cydia strobilella TaxID=1100964 RepID=UPI003006E345